MVIASGIYREAIHPARGGTGPGKLISYEAAPGANVVISGAMVGNNWAPSSGFGSRGQHKGNPQIYEAKLDGDWFGGYNPFAMVNLPQQKAFLVTVGNRLPGSSGYNMPWLREKNNLATYYRRRGLVFVDSKPLSQVDTFEELFDPAGPPRPSSRPVNPTIVEEPQNHLFDEFGGSAGRVFIENDGLTLHIRLNDDGSPSRVDPPKTVSSNAYVDSRTCAECHGAIAESFGHTGMGRSISRATSDNMPEDFAVRNTVYNKASGDYYTMIRRGDESYQRRHQIGFDGKETNVVEERIDYVIGSGDQARSFLHQTPKES